MTSSFIVQRLSYCSLIFVLVNRNASISTMLSNTERTFLAVKPDAVLRGLIGDISKRRLQVGGVENDGGQRIIVAGWWIFCRIHFVENVCFSYFSKEVSVPSLCKLESFFVAVAGNSLPLGFRKVEEK